MALLACCMFSISSSSEFISCTWAVLTSSNAFEKTSGMSKPWTLCATMYVASPLNLLARYRKECKQLIFIENQQCALRNLYAWAKHIQKHMLTVHFDCQRFSFNAMNVIWKHSYFFKPCQCGVQKMSALSGHCMYWIRQAHASEHGIVSFCQVHHECGWWWHIAIFFVCGSDQSSWGMAIFWVPSVLWPLFSASGIGTRVSSDTGSSV